MQALEFRVVDLPEASLHKAAVLVLGQHRAVLVGAGLRLSDGRRLAREVRTSGRRLTAVLAVHSAPDCWLAAEVLRDEFPEARFLAPAQVLDRIGRDYPVVHTAWAGLGPELPTRLVAFEPLEGDAVELEDHRLELRGASLGLPDHHYLWEHRSRTLLGGPLLWLNVHPWIADTPTAAQREAWIGLLDEMAALEPERAVAGHRFLTTPAADHTPDPVAWTGDYLRAFETELGKPAGADEVEAALLRRYPAAALPAVVRPGVAAARMEPAHA
ncbi:MBL fold metallo-hydrolase [Streptomyces sp. TLI_171]|uniref:MBL fold metallo-hydrolase n=1 Tax=Streptomyces sp. TLI_171 TaxID=1938859 RepID=UPI000C1A43D0|nr:MBL fold metallo-hydrolase [Streptomyces sp. TLI_171]RKE21887.1 metallo-beta-lactamase superfamily protein [Streptomyces sp. TLI_171]